MKSITIALDAMGGDYGPSVIVPAALITLEKHKDLHLILVGDKQVLEQWLSNAQLGSRQRIQIQHSSQQVAMDDKPAQALRNKKDSSMRVAINLVKQGTANACVSAGNTGALMATAKFVLGTLPGIDRPAFISPMPSVKGYTHVLDLGANVNCNADHLLQFAVMGSVLSQAVGHIKRPSIGLLNVGTEEMKGNELVQQAAGKLKACTNINYVGFVEGDAFYKGQVDVLVCDGFVGNVALKASEGLVKMIVSFSKQAFKRTLLTRIVGFLALPVLKSLKKRLNPDSHNGASLIGLKGIVIKSHGGANTEAFACAIDEAMLEVRSDVPAKIKHHLEKILVPDEKPHEAQAN